LKTTDFEYDLPQEFIAQLPIEPRDSSRLMVIERKSGKVKDQVKFRNLDRFLCSGDLLVLNETRVIPARLFAHKIPGGGKVELLLLRTIGTQTWECLVGGKGLVKGKQVRLENGVHGVITAVLSGPRRLIQFSRPLIDILDTVGQVPLPPYIHEKLEKPDRYQTVYSKTPGSAAAPTAGLHFTTDLLSRLKKQGIYVTSVTLHVGLDTFVPVTEDDPIKHEIHTEWCHVSSESATMINQVKRNGGRIVAVGTTSVRTLETVAIQNQNNETWTESFSGPTNLFILPGYKFKIVDAIITNFHLPRSTLIMLVSAFIPREKVLAAYEFAKKEKYRFYSFGDAMLII
jgi:S-adenosylmethionine:tRNA ribosyltransferase-isomerase